MTAPGQGQKSLSAALMSGLARDLAARDSSCGKRADFVAELSWGAERTV